MRPSVGVRVGSIGIDVNRGGAFKQSNTILCWRKFVDTRRPLGLGALDNQSGSALGSTDSKLEMGVTRRNINIHQLWKEIETYPDKLISCPFWRLPR